MKLTEKKCKPCEGGIPPLNTNEINAYREQIHHDWRVIDEEKISRNFRFINFKQTMSFVNKVAQLAEEEGHHPDLHVGYGTCTIDLWTHAIKGLSENDFILAAKIDELLTADTIY
jgi:4a-hydroxytetrahydrobiopterin dehydratase